MAVASAQPAVTGSNSDRVPIPPAAPAAAEPAPELTAPALPEVGQVWLGQYQIAEALPEIAGARAWRAQRLDLAEDVILRAVASPPGDRRADAWRVLTGIEHPHLLRTQPAVRVGGLRVEVQSAPPGRPLSAWHPEGDAAQHDSIDGLVAAISSALASLQARGLAHFSVRPQHVFVKDTSEGPHFVLGGLESVALVEQSGLMPVKVDPFYAPPEAAGLFQHSPGPGLLAWDWWSLGRVVQERVLGKHVLGVILNRDVSRATPELNARAENLLLERESGGPRAGAVEAMPAVSPRLAMLLRGLLTSSRDGRWNHAQVQRWLAGEEVSDYYRLPKNEKLFRWNDRAWTVAEAADRIRTHAPTAEAVGHVWNVEQPGTLVRFLGDTGECRTVRERHDEVLKLAAATALKSIKPEAVREMTAALALMELAGGSLVWRGHRLLADNLEKIFGEALNGPDGLSLIEAFTARPIVLFIEHNDLAAARALGDVAETATAAEVLLRKFRLLSERDAAGRARLYRCALKPAAELLANLEELRRVYACTTHEELNRIFKLPKLARPELLALAWIADKPGARGFLTFPLWGERELARLRATGVEQATVLTWLRLGDALRLGPLVFGQWRFFVPFWLLLSLPIAFVWPGPRGLALGLAPAVVAVVVRFLLARRLRAQIGALLPKIEPWHWRDSRARCRTELVTLGAGNRTTPGMAASFEKTNAEIAGLAMLEPRPAPNPPAPHFRGLALVAWASLVFAAGLVALSAWRIKVEKPTWPKFVTAWREAVPKKAEPLTEEELAKKEGRPVRVSWPYKPTDDPAEWKAGSIVEATKDQVKFANARGQEIAQAYKPETITTLVFLRVPTDYKFGLMLYDCKRRQLENTRLFLLDFSPLPRSYIEVGGKRGIYLPD